MIILHAGLHGETLILWGEVSDDHAGSDTRDRTEAPVKGRHPFSATAGQLREVVTSVVHGPTGDQRADRPIGRAQFALDHESASARTCDVAAWLLTFGKRPVPSSPLIGESRKTRTKIASWTIAGYRLQGIEAVHLLQAAAGERTLAPGIIVGADLAFWAETARFAGSLVARQLFLPSYWNDTEDPRATWDPVITGDDAERAISLARRMPAVARALAEPGASSPPETPSSVVLGRFLGRITDHLVRTSAFAVSPPPARGRRAAFDSVHDAWLDALKSSDGLVAGETYDLLDLAAQVREWRRPLSLWASSPFRLCFRLEEPLLDVAPEEEDDGPEDPGTDIGLDSADAEAADASWYVRYLVQPHDDPSLLIPLNEAWADGGAAIPAPRQGGPGMREFLLASLGQASRVCPPIDASLESEVPDGYPLDTAGAHGFLSQDAIALEEAGYGVMLPAWWTRRGTRVRLSVGAKVRSPKMQGGSGMSLEEIVKFDWTAALGDAELTYDELLELAQMKTPLVRVRGQWVEMSAADIRAAINFLKGRANEEATVRDVIKVALGAGEEIRGIELRGITATGWIDKILGQLEGNLKQKDLASPRGFTGELRPYQVRGYSWLSFLQKWGLGACLADDMGLGKTIQTLALIQRNRRASKKRPVLLVCPTSVVNNWVKEAARFTPGLPVLVHHGPARSRGTEFRKEAEGRAIVVTSYALAQRDIDFLKEVPWSGVVLDEAQNIKNPETKQARAARSLPADYRIALTGTPVENNVGDLWSIMEFLNPGFLGSQTAFRQNYFVPIQSERDPGAAERLRRITGPFILRRLKTDRSIISDLPDKLEAKVFCPLTREQASLYASVLKQMEETLEASEGIQRRGMVLATLLRLKQVCNHPALFLDDNSAVEGRSGKLTRLTEMLGEIIEVGDRALIFSQFSEMGEMLRNHVQEMFGMEVLFLHGGVSKGRRDRMVERFQSGNGGPQVFVLSLKAGGTGLNLTAANHVFHFDRWWNPAVEDQATDRVFRIGQEKNVQVHKFICAGTLEDKIDEMIERKKAVADEVVGTGEGWLTELSNDDLRQVLALSKDAAGG